MLEALPKDGLRRWWPQRLLVAALLVMFCSCRTVPSPLGPSSGPLATAPSATAPAPAPAVAAGGMPSPTSYGVQLAQYASAPPPAAACPGPGAYGLPPGMTSAACGACPSCPPADCGSCQPSTWRPRANEFLCDGGDQGVQVEVLRDRTTLGLDAEDTVAQYDTLDGRTEVEPSNPVCLYAPRFAAVRQISGLLVHEAHDRLAHMAMPLLPNAQEQRGVPTTVLQPIEPERYVGTDSPQLFRERSRGESVDGAQGLVKLDGHYRLHEDFRLIRAGLFDNSEKARLAERLAAASVWSETQAVQVVIDKTTAVVAANDLGLQSVYRYELPPGKPRLRIVKVASKPSAQPGDDVEFTLRFDNVGDQTVGNVTIVDNLTTRLEYVPDTAQCDLEAKFYTQENDGESLVLRWEIRRPLKVGEGGIIRFTCRVR